MIHRSRPATLTCACCNQKYHLIYPFQRELYLKHICQHTTENVTYFVPPVLDFYPYIWRYLAKYVLNAPIAEVKLNPICNN